MLVDSVCHTAGESWRETLNSVAIFLTRPAIYLTSESGVQNEDSPLGKLQPDSGFIWDECGLGGECLDCGAAEGEMVKSLTVQTWWEIQPSIWSASQFM